MNVAIKYQPTQLARACSPAAIAGAGGKGGGNARTPVETPDSLHSISYAKIIDLISEGEIRGLVAGNQSVYLNQVPIQNSDGTLNFAGVRVETRAGTQDQEYIAGFPSVENEVPVGVELRSNAPVVRTVSGADLSAVRIRFSVPALQRQNTENGDTEGYAIEYAIDLSVNGGAFSTVLSNAFRGKTTSEYQRSHRIDLPAGTQWQVRVRRLTPNANSSTVADIVMVQSLTEIIDAKLRYPNCALAAVQVDASAFQNVPSRAFQIWGRIIRVPSNYDPRTRSYSGVWDGTFKSAWTNNPAWVFFDIVTNDRFGLGNRIPLDWVDKWRLYEIAQYCDQLVSDGMGGQEPRFTCSLYLQTRADAYKVLQDMASMFRGISFYAAGQVMASADKPKDPVYTYSQANVVDGRFTYEGSARKVRHTVALVSWTDPDDFGRQKVEPVQLLDGIARYGVNQIEVTALGCHSKSQAQRVGNHILYSENLETETVTFAVGLDALNCMPGDVIQVADANRAGRRNSGRVSAATANSLTLDVVPPTMAVGDLLRATLPSGKTEARTINGINPTTRVVTVSAPWSAVPVSQSIWATESTDLVLQQFRVLGIAEEEGLTYRITALQHRPDKFAAIDDGTRLEPPPISVIPPSVQPPPANVRMSSHVVIDQGIATPVLTIEWDAADKAIAYDVEWRRDDLNWVRAGRVGTTSCEVRGIYAGKYLARVRAVNALNAVSQPTLSMLTDIKGKTEPPPALTSLTATPVVFGIQLAWGFPPGATDTERTEIWRSAGPDRASATKFADFAYPQNRYQLDGLAAGARFYFWGRLVDKSGNIGPWYPAGAGVMGEASTNQSDYDAYFSGKISESALGQDLLAKIESIDQIVPLIWEAGATYEPGETVVYNGKIWLWNDNAPGNEEPPGTKWKDVGDAIAQAGAVVGRVNTLELQVNDPETGLQAIGQKTDGLFAQLDVHAAGDSDWGAGDSTVFAGTLTIQTVIAEGDYALARRQDTVEASVGETQALGQQTFQALVDLDGKISVSYSLKLQIAANGQYYAAGMGIGIENQPDGSYQSQILFQADRLALINLVNGQVTTPFVIQGGQTFISQALIGTAWINTANIADAAITNAKIGGVIQSDNYVPGQTGWRISKDGGFELNGNTPDGYKTRVVNGGVYVYHPNGTAVVEVGVLL
ncbi:MULTISPECIES: host specificity protein J [unclassified Stenotrophomonas]|uniref:host specificity protein J n=1 Tax=unclassified Stenotrophomonas TaxID=196198 RepID=UPI0024479099|nr:MULTISPECIES: host specificity protein J [unclassified Stenotrophomonas]MBN5158854.1 host specificity protein J [Stenotrophomonas maltophilia]MDG9843744.1 host specificity protein J [Stenotrophomonas sp. GD04054]MDH0016116.1 host specificity protein J [Stenotrophomonas sp. GD04028]MDH0577471.1 host specificity protein J [Stenotrophomonas sp. GD03997]MDH0859419.1 host specificity protein J [Stenotrophomonas sp. GD03882]